MLDFINAASYEDLCDYSIILKESKLFDKSILHNNGIIFCKTDHIDYLFKRIRKSSNNYILITHHSDYPIDYNKFKIKPSCIRKWFGINVTFAHNDLIPIPVGLKTHKGVFIEPHIKTLWLAENIACLKNNIKDETKVYCNWTDTNLARRTIIKVLEANKIEYCWEAGLSFEDYCTSMSRFRFVISPPGNGLDSHRTWECLYMGCIPVVIKNKIYDNWDGLPILQVEDYSELTYDKMHEFAGLKFNYEKLYATYWKDLIKKTYTELCERKMIALNSTAKTISGNTCTTCKICGSTGRNVYLNIPDYTGVASGNWDIMKCSENSCGLFWINPMPLEEDIWKAYTTYFTHSDYIAPKQVNLGYTSRLIGKLSKPFFKLYLSLSKLRQYEKQIRKQAETLYLGPSTCSERLLDVGCGNGDFISRMQRLGWVTEGTEMDSHAAENARKKTGATIHLGKLENLSLPPQTFDVITMSHVIEHVHDPISIIRECYKLLKPGGRMVLVTPNPESLGHKIFTQHWICLLPPSHLQLFTQNALRKCATYAGFEDIETFSTPPGTAENIYMDSSTLKEKENSHRNDVFKIPRAYIFKAKELSALIKGAGLGEENVLIGRTAQ